jgi:hypothetical protein
MCSITLDITKSGYRWGGGGGDLRHWGRSFRGVRPLRHEHVGRRHHGLSGRGRGGGGVDLLRLSPIRNGRSIVLPLLDGGSASLGTPLLYLREFVKSNLKNCSQA